MSRRLAREDVDKRISKDDDGANDPLGILELTFLLRICTPDH